MIKLKCWRRKKGLTRVQLATLLGTSAGYIYEIECGKKLPSISLLYRIADALNICVKDLLICNCKKCSKRKAME